MYVVVNLIMQNQILQVSCVYQNVDSRICGESSAFSGDIIQSILKYTS